MNYGILFIHEMTSPLNSTVTPWSPAFPVARGRAPVTSPVDPREGPRKRHTTTTSVQALLPGLCATRRHPRWRRCSQASGEFSQWSDEFADEMLKWWRNWWLNAGLWWWNGGEIDGELVVNDAFFEDLGDCEAWLVVVVCHKHEALCRTMIQI